MKDWTEPNGIFIINIPIEWQYVNTVMSDGIEESPYSFEPYDNDLGCFQISCYPLAKQGINPNFPIQNNNSKIEWFRTRMDDDEFNMHLFYAQVDDQFCMAKYIYSKAQSADTRIKQELENVDKALDRFRVIPTEDRLLAANLKKHDNFIGSLIASHDLLERAYENESHIELVVILANQIDAFLRSAIILHEQLRNKTNDIEIKYIFQGDDENGIVERKIYSKAKGLNIIDEKIYNELNDLYDQRNKVIHRYIISFLKTRDILKLAYDYTLIKEKIRLILQRYEEMQFGKGFGIYGRRYSKEDIFNDQDYKRANSMINDKHLLEKLNKKL